MYNICLHISAISIIEILFYFYYIAPLETEIFQKTFDDAISKVDLSEFDSIIHISSVNKSELLLFEHVILEDLKNDANDANHEKDIYNNKLFLNTIIYWSIFSACIIPIFFIQYKYEKYKKKESIKTIGYDNDDSISSSDEIELILFKRLRKSSIDETEPENEITEKETDDTHLLKKIKKRKRNKYIISFIRYILLGGGIVTFQYLFFNHVILKYHILTNEELQYTILKQFFPKLNNILFN